MNDKKTRVDGSRGGQSETEKQIARRVSESNIGLHRPREAAGELAAFMKAATKGKRRSYRVYMACLLL